MVNSSISVWINIESGYAIKVVNGSDETIMNGVEWWSVWDASGAPVFGDYLCFYILYRAQDTNGRPMVDLSRTYNIRNPY